MTPEMSSAAYSAAAHETDQRQYPLFGCARESEPEPHFMTSLLIDKHETSLDQNKQSWHDIHLAKSS